MIVQTSRRQWVNFSLLRSISIEADKYNPDAWTVVGIYDGGKVLPLGPAYKTEAEAVRRVNQLLELAFGEFE